MFHPRVKRILRTTIISLFILQNLLPPPVVVAAAQNSTAVAPVQTASLQADNAGAPPIRHPLPVDQEFADASGALDEALYDGMIATAAPVGVRLSTDHEYLLNGVKAQLTIEIWRGGTAAVTGAQVSVALPDALKTVGANQETSWVLPNLALEELFTRVIEVKIDNAAVAPGLVDVTLTVTPANALPTIETSLELGVIPNLNELPDVTEQEAVQGDGGTAMGVEGGDMVLLAPANAMPVGTKLRYKRGQSAQAAPGKDMVNAPILRQWDFTAEHNGSAIDHFDRPLLLVLDVRQMAREQGVHPSLLGLFTRKTAADAWQPVETVYIAKRQVLIARLHHFSEYHLGLEEDVNVKGDILPSVNSFSSDLFTGAATISYPIEAPKGPGRMGPNLSLSYTSGTVDDFFHSNDTTHKYEAQAGWAGLGWNLGGIGFIGMVDRNEYAEENDDLYSLVLNGAISAQIREDGVLNNETILKMAPEQFVRVTRHLEEIHTDVDLNGKVVDAGTWTVTTQDGTQHTFGGFATDPRMAVDDSAQGMIIDFVRDQWQVNKWWLTESVDAMGNYVSYSYISNARDIRQPNEDNCKAGSKHNDKWYYRDIRPHEITWGGNKNTLAEPTMKVVFGYEGRTDYEVDDKDERCVQSMWTDQRLQTITFMVMSNGDWQPLRQYQFAYTYSTGVKAHSLLASIKQYSYSASNDNNNNNDVSDDNLVGPLHTYSFAYEQRGNHAQVYLNSADNG